MSYQLIDYITIYAKEWDNLVTEFLRHLAMTSFAVIFALLLAVPLGILITHSKLLSKIIIGFANIMQSIPCMALLALGIPILHVGETLAIFMVFVYAFLPILKSTYTGISSISPVSVEVARGIGLNRMQQLRRVKLPMAMPYIMSGIRIAAVGAVSTMTIAAFAGAKGLGWFIMLGMNSQNYPMTVMGAVAAAVMALVLDYLLGRVERAFTSEGLLPQNEIKNQPPKIRLRKKAVAALLCSALVVASVFSYGFIIRPSGTSDKTIVVGTSNYTEVQILGEIYTELIESNTDYHVEQRFGLAGASVCFSSLESGGIDMFVEYTGTALMNLLGQPVDTDPNAVWNKVHDMMLEEHGIVTSKPLGFNNTYVMSVKPETAERYGISTLSQLLEKSPELSLGCTVEFIQREDCLPLLEKDYGAKFKDVKGLDASLRYTAIDNNEVDVVDAFATDALLSKLGLTMLEDDISFFPPYYAVNFVDADLLQADPELQEVLSRMDGKIDDKTMAAMNAQVDIDGMTASEVAHHFLVENDLVPVA